MKEGLSRSGSRLVNVLLALLLCAAGSSLASAEGSRKADPPMDPPSHHTGDAGPQHPEHGSLGNMGAKLANPVSDQWAIQFNFEGPTFSDGDLNTGDPKLGGNVVFQPVMPIPVYGSGKDTWRLIVRPVLPIVMAQPVPTCQTLGCNQFDTKGGLGDWNWEMFLTAPTSFTRLPENLILGVGASVVFPTSTSDALGSQQFAMGPGLVLGWKTPKFTFATVTNYNFHVGDRSDRKITTPDTSSMTLLYALIFNLPNAWQVGMNPTISYNNQASSGNKWNVPIGLFGAKTTMIGKIPFNIRLGVEYSVVSQDSFGKRAIIRLQVTPVIASLIKKSIFGGS
jgi:hypothetical protein